MREAQEVMIMRPLCCSVFKAHIGDNILDQFGCEGARENVWFVRWREFDWEHELPCFRGPIEANFLDPSSIKVVFTEGKVVMIDPDDPAASQP